MDFVNLTMVYSSYFFVDKAHVAPKLSLVNVVAFNKVLHFEIFVSEDGQLLAVHLVLDFKPLSNAFQDTGQAIRAGNPRINRIDVSRLGFLARYDLPLVELPPQHSPREIASPREETASSRLSIEANIDQFQLEEEGALERPVELSNSKVEFDRLFVAHSPRFTVVRVNTSSEEEEMALNPRRGLRDLVASRKGSSSRDGLKVQLPPNPALPPSVCTPTQICRRRKGRRSRKGRLPH